MLEVKSLIPPDRLIEMEVERSRFQSVICFLIMKPTRIRKECELKARVKSETERIE